MSNVQKYYFQLLQNQVTKSTLYNYFSREFLKLQSYTDLEVGIISIFLSLNQQEKQIWML